MERVDYYETLEINREATPQEIKEAYRRLAFQCHPDRNNGDTTAAERMKAINEAYAVLSDPQKRKNYDGYRHAYGEDAYSRFRQGYSEEDIFRGSDINQIFEEMARSFGVRGFEDVFRAAYGSNYRTFQFGNGGLFGRGFVFTGPMGGHNGRNGSAAQPSLPGIFTGLTGKIVGYVLKKMTGVTLPESGRDRYDRLIIRPEEAVRGSKVPYRDRHRSKEILITVPTGVRSGQTIRLKGMGHEGRAGGSPGDLYLTVEVKKPLWDRIKGLRLRTGMTSPSSNQPSSQDRLS